MSWLSKGLKKLEGAVASVIPHQTAAERRMKSDAISSYYAQKDAAVAEQARISGEKEAERKRIQEKTIRSMRRRYRSAGFMQPMSDMGTQEKLG